MESSGFAPAIRGVYTVSGFCPLPRCLRLFAAGSALGLGGTRGGCGPAKLLSYRLTEGDVDPRQITSKKAPRGPGGAFPTSPGPPKANFPSTKAVLVPILDEARPFAPSSRPKQKYPGGGGEATSSSCPYMPPPMPISAPPPQSRPRPTSWPRQLNSAERSSPRSSRNRLREHTPELRTGCEVKFAPADLSSSVRETSAMGVNDAVPVSKMSSVFVPLLLHLAPA